MTNVAASGAGLTFVVTESIARVVALVVLVGLALLLHTVAARGVSRQDPDLVRLRKRGLKGLVMGSDGRASTSKVQAALWTVAVLYALTFLLLWGRSVGCRSYSADPSCQEAARGRDAFSRELNDGLELEYYVLLGLPYAAVLAAKSMTSAKLADDTIEKKPITTEDRGVAKSLGEIVTNDEGETDLLDFQYFAFNLLTLAFFFTEFLGDPGSGLPQLPPTLIALSGLSIASYTTKKALETRAWDRGNNQNPEEEP